MTTLYHKTEPPKTVSTQEDVERLLAQGWADTPAAFYDIPEPIAVPARKARKDTK